MGDWIAENWFVFLQSAGIIGSLLFAGIALERNSRAIRVENLIRATGNHRDIWKYFHETSELSRVVDSFPGIEKKAVTEEERAFVILIVLHVSSLYHAVRNRVLKKPDGMEKDVGEFFSLPIPRSVWASVKKYQDREVVEFVERCVSEGRETAKLSR